MDTKYMINIIGNDDKPFSVSIRTGEYTLHHLPLKPKENFINILIMIDL